MSVLSNVDIEIICKKLKLPLITCCSKDQLPKQKQKQKGFYIVNMQNDKDEYGNQLAGSHWVAFGITKNGAFYCDSMGVIPPTLVSSYLKEFKPVPYNIQEIQDIHSTDCGWFSVAVCAYIHKSKKNTADSLTDFINMFSKTDLIKNNIILQEYFSSLI